MKEKIKSIITNEEQRTRMQYIVVFLVLGVVSVFITILNIVTHKGALIWATGILSFLCFLNFAIVLISPKRRGMNIASSLFLVEMVVMMTYFGITGSPEGFSILWAAMLPGCGMLLFGIKRTSIVCAVLFLILAFLFWTPLGRSLLQYEYTETFKMRFPILFTVFFFISALLEIIRANTQKELDKLREKYKYLSSHDYLTSLLNRQGIMDLVKTLEVTGEQTVFILDIDHFKVVNDNYGHDVGDMVLAEIARIASDEAPDAKVCRWGGEEFVIWFPKGGGDAEALRQRVEKMVLAIPNTEKNISVTVSIGAARGEGELTELISRADSLLYKAKQNGRNRVELEY